MSFMFILTWGNDSHFDSYFSTGLVETTNQFTYWRLLNPSPDPLHPSRASIYIGLGGGWPKSFGRRQKTLEVVFVHFWSRSHSRALSDLKTWRSFNKNVQRCKKSKKSGEVGLLLNYQLQSYMFGAHVINTCLICCMTASAICQLRPSLA